MFCFAIGHLLITPQSPVLEIGTNFTATCMIINTNENTTNELYWKLCERRISAEHYTKINRSAISVTIPVTDEKCEWLYCQKESSYVYPKDGKFLHGIHLTKGCKFLFSVPINLAVAFYLTIYINLVIISVVCFADFLQTTGKIRDCLMTYILL